MANLAPLNLQIVNPSGHGTMGSGNGGGPPMDHDYATKTELQMLSSKMALNFQALNDRFKSLEARLDEQTKSSDAQFQAQAEIAKANLKAQMVQIKANEKAAQANLDKIDQVAKERNEAIAKQFAWMNYTGMNSQVSKISLENIVNCESQELLVIPTRSLGWPEL